MRRKVVLKIYWLGVLATFLFLLNCKKEESSSTSKNKELLSIPQGFPEMPFPDDNQFTRARWELGKKLFFDPILSIDSSISCGSCHKPTLAFADEVALSEGVKSRAGVRNSISLANIGYHPYFLREGSVPTLEMQILVPIQEHNEFNHNIVEISNLLQTIPEYVSLSNQAYSSPPNPFVITRAIGVFERSLISGNSNYDKFQNGASNALNESAKRGLDIFFGAKANCSSCHGGFNFTDYTFQNNGLALDYEDIGRMIITNDSSDLALFKTPSLRNIELTAPYMHKGQLASLEEVIDHYNRGGEQHRNQSEMVKPLNLTMQEKKDLLAFLKSLTDYEFTGDPRWQ